MIRLNINSSKTKDRIIRITFISVFILLFYSTNTMLVNSTDTDYPPHISQAWLFGQIWSIGIHEFFDTAPLYKALINPGWHISILPFYTILRMLYLTVEDSLRLSASLLNAVFNTAAIVAITDIFQKKIKQEVVKTFAPVLATVMIFVGPLYIPAVNTLYYLGQLFSGVWHNPTSQPLKVFVIINFFLFIYMLENREQLGQQSASRPRIKLKKLDLYFILFSLLLLLSGVFKSNLNTFFIPSLFIYCCIDVITTRFKSFWFCFKTGLAVIPSCILILIQSTILEELATTTVIFAPMLVWNHFSPYPFLSIIISLPFPIFTCIIGFKKIIANKMMLLSAIMLVVSILIFILFAFDPGTFYPDFGWGMMVCTLLIFVTSFIFFTNEIIEIDIKKTRAKVIVITGVLLLTAQFLFGSLYYYLGVTGKISFQGGLF